MKMIVIILKLLVWMTNDGGNSGFDNDTVDKSGEDSKLADDADVGILVKIVVIVIAVKTMLMIPMSNVV